MTGLRHSWVVEDDGIEVCRICGMYKCYAQSKPGGAGRPRKMDVEYSLDDGTVIALNPDEVPECGYELEVYA